MKDAQKVMSYIRHKDLSDFSREVIREKGFLYFSIKNNKLEEKKLKEKFSNLTFSKKSLKKKEKKETDLRKSLEKHLSNKELDNLVTAYDVVGSIAILDIPKELRKKERLIADILLNTQKSIKTVLRKEDIHSGTYRTQKMKFLAGVKTKETVHKENNVSLKLDVESVYFSTRSSHERKRIASKVKKGENVLVMFSGCGPFVCVIAKNSSPEFVYGVEINPKQAKISFCFHMIPLS